MVNASVSKTENARSNRAALAIKINYEYSLNKLEGYIMNIKQTWVNSTILTKRMIKVISILSAVVAIYGGLNVFLGVTIRPAWAWELQALSRQQLDIALQVEQGDRREFSRDLSRYRSMRDGYIRRGQPVPSWLVDEINNGENDLLKIDRSIDTIQQEMVNMN